jgi:hypothetical protein
MNPLSKRGIFGVEKTLFCACRQADFTIAVLSEAYLKSEYTQPEWAAAFAQDPHRQEAQADPRARGRVCPHGDACTNQEVADWLYYLVKERELSASSVNIAVNAVRFLYGITLER